MLKSLHFKFDETSIFFEILKDRLFTSLTALLHFNSTKTTWFIGNTKCDLIPKTTLQKNIRNQKKQSTFGFNSINLQDDKNKQKENHTCSVIVMWWLLLCCYTVIRMTKVLTPMLSRFPGTSDCSTVISVFLKLTRDHLSMWLISLNRWVSFSWRERAKAHVVFINLWLRLSAL